MKHVIITGGTRGIGAGLVEEFVKKGCRVTFSGTSDRSVTSSYENFNPGLNPSMYKGVVCDVTRPEDIEMLWDFGTKLFGTVDIWINNAGVSNVEKHVNNLTIEEIDRVILTNIKGLIAGTHIACNKMLKQGKGSIYNMGGLGSDGRVIKGLTPYGMSKRAVQYFTSAFAKELKGSTVSVSLLLPGMVITDMILDPIRKDPEGSKRARRIFNILGEEVETVSEFLVDQILANEKNGATISFLTPWKTMKNFITRPLTGRDIITRHL